MDEALRKAGVTASALGLATRLPPHHARARVELGDLFRHAGNHLAAGENYRVAIQLDPESPTAYRKLALLLEERGMIDAAIECHRHLVRLDPGSAAKLYTLGLQFGKRKHDDEALDCFRRAVGIDPKHAGAHTMLGVKLYAVGRYADAAEHLQVAQDIRGGPRDLDEAILLAQAKRFRDLDARLPFLLSGQETPANAREYLDFASLCAKRGYYFEATRLHARAFGLEMKFRLGPTFRHEAACAVVRAANGEGVNPVEAEDRPGLRQFALRLLTGDLNWLRAIEAKGLDKDRPALREMVKRWLEDEQLASVRDPKALQRLPETERKAWERFWARVRVAGTDLGRLQQQPPR